MRKNIQVKSPIARNLENEFKEVEIKKKYPIKKRESESQSEDATNQKKNESK